MKITALIENTHAPACPRLSVEPGLSLWITLRDHHILFDSGVSGAFIQNAVQLNIDVSQADLAVLSHHHYDHAGGLRAFFEVNSQRAGLAWQKRQRKFTTKRIRAAEKTDRNG